MKVKLKLFFVVVQNDFCCLASFEKKNPRVHVMYEVFVAPIIFVKLCSPL